MSKSTCPKCGNPLIFETKYGRKVQIKASCEQCGCSLESTHSWLDLLKQSFSGIQRLPYKWAWGVVMVATILLFSWWDELIVWGIGIAMLWWVVPLFYFIEYAVFLPIVLCLAYKTYKRLGLSFNVKEQILDSLRRSLPVILVKKLRKKKP